MDLLELEEITINTIKFDIKKNVKDVFLNMNTAQKTLTFYEDPIDENNLAIFLLFENPFHEAFGHWVFESAIFLPFVDYFTKYKNFFIVVNKNNERKYKKSFFKMFNINEKNIYYIDNTYTHTNEISYKNIPKNNISIICSNFVINQGREYFNNILIENITFLINNFYNIILENIKCEKQIEHLFMPRNKIENYIPNDRQINYDSINSILENKEYICYDTQETDNFIEQVILIQKSKNIYLNWGSSYIVNGFFSKDSNIYIAMNGITYNCYNHLIGNIILNIIEKNNNIILV